MHAEIISVGTELTTGAMLDTNSQWLSLELAAIGIPVHFHTTVADDLDAMAGVLRTAAERSDLILLTGGLGPTLDDLTRQALAAVLGTELVLDDNSLDFIRSIFARHNREMPERNSHPGLFSRRQRADRQSARHGPRHLGRNSPRRAPPGLSVRRHARRPARNEADVPQRGRAAAARAETWSSSGPASTASAWANRRPKRCSAT